MTVRLSYLANQNLNAEFGNESHYKHCSLQIEKYQELEERDWASSAGASRLMPDLCQNTFTQECHKSKQCHPAELTK